MVLVLSEAFADLGRLDGMSVSRDTMPLTRETRAASWGGDTLANAYGTGTSGMEFEALTGQSLGLFNPQVTAPYQNFMAGLSDYPSAVAWFAEHGHVPLAVHPYHRDFYRRDVIYPMLGFRDFVDEKTIADKDHLEDSDYISDEAAFNEVEHQIAVQERPLLVNLVTMQNHVPTADWYSDRVPVESPGGREIVDSIGGYARGQEYTDASLRAFLDDLGTSAEPTVVVFYGDHYPALLPDEVLAANPGLGQLTTPMFIWSSEGQTPRPAADDQPDDVPAAGPRPPGRAAAALLPAPLRRRRADRGDRTGTDRDPGRPGDHRGRADARAAAPAAGLPARAVRLLDRRALRRRRARGTRSTDQHLRLCGARARSTTPPDTHVTRGGTGPASRPLGTGCNPCRAAGHADQSEPL